MDPIGFWELTPPEFEAIMEGAKRRQAHKHNACAWLAWHIAALGKHQKRLPPLQSLIVTPRGRKKRQTWRQQQEIALMLTNLYGGTVH